MTEAIFMVEAVLAAAVEEGAKLMNSISTRTILHANIARNLATKKLTIGRSKRMSRIRQISQKNGRRK